jgi:uncharacterized iron-regulated membrane protein
MHLSVGLVAGAVILYLSVTGLLMAFKPQIIDLSRAGLVSADAGPALPVVDLLKKISDGKTEELKSVTFWREKEGYFEAQFGKEKHLYAYADGSVLPASYAWNEFFELTTNLHRWFSPKNEGDHKVQKLIKGISVIFFLFLTFSGIFLWWPSAVKKLNFKLKNKAFNWNLHNVLGFWFSPVIIIISVTGLVIAHQWANNLLFAIAGSEVPKPRKIEEKAQVIPPAEQLAGMIAVAQERKPNWKMLSVRFSKGYVNLSIDEDGPAGLYAKSQLSFDAESGQESFWEPYESLPTARKVRATMHPVHTGEAGGFFGQVLVALATLVSIVLVWTGFAMSYRRFFKTKQIKKSQVGDLAS